jgi:hypothetical protein
MVHQLMPKTFCKKYIIKNICCHISRTKISNLSPIDIKKWYNNFMSDNNYSQTYLKKINDILNTIFNYNSKCYNLKNPCIKAGSIGSHKSKEMVIW